MLWAAMSLRRRRSVGAGSAHCSPAELLATPRTEKCWAPLLGAPPNCASTRAPARRRRFATRGRCACVVFFLSFILFYFFCSIFPPRMLFSSLSPFREQRGPPPGNSQND